MTLSKADAKRLKGFVDALDIDARLIQLALDEKNLEKAERARIQLSHRLELVEEYFLD